MPALAGACMIFVGESRQRFRGRQGTVDCEARLIAELFQKRVFHRFLAGGQHEFQFRAVRDVGAHGPDFPVHALHVRQAHVEREPVEIEIRLVVERVTGPDHAERDPVPVLPVQRGFQKIVVDELGAVE